VRDKKMEKLKIIQKEWYEKKFSPGEARSLR
jgi:hypothetical protein